MEYHIVADVGGTQIRVAVYPKGSTTPFIVKKIRTRDKSQTPEERLAGLIKELWPSDGRVRCIVAAIPGFLDPESGIVFEASNVPGWRNIHLKEILESQIEAPVFIGNDANLAALGEWKYGAGIGFHDLLYITISTGIGGGAIIRDRLLLGSRGLAAEFGHVTVIPDGPTCGCGQRGHLEAVASGTAIARFVSEKIALGFPTSLAEVPNPTAADISRAAAEGDTLALRAMNRAGTYIGFALADYLHLLNPSIIILGGGVSASGNLIVDPIKAALPERIMDRIYLKDLVITTAALGDNAGLMGALALAESVPDI